MTNQEKVFLIICASLIIFTLLSSFTLGSLGVIAGLWAEKFDHMASVTNFIIVPLSLESTKATPHAPFI